MRLGLKAWLCANTWSRHAKQLIPHDSVSLCAHKMRVCGHDWFEVCVKSAYSHYTFLLFKFQFMCEKIHVHCFTVNTSFGGLNLSERLSHLQKSPFILFGAFPCPGVCYLAFASKKLVKLQKTCSKYTTKLLLKFHKLLLRISIKYLNKIQFYLYSAQITTSDASKRFRL